MTQPKNNPHIGANAASDNRIPLGNTGLGGDALKPKDPTKEGE